MRPVSNSRGEFDFKSAGSASARSYSGGAINSHIFLRTRGGGSGSDVLVVLLCSGSLAFLGVLLCSGTLAFVVV